MGSVNADNKKRIIEMELKQMHCASVARKGGGREGEREAAVVAQNGNRSCVCR